MRNRLTDIDNKPVVAKIENHIGTNYYVYKINSKDILYSTVNYSHYLVITYYGVSSAKVLNHYAIYLKPTFNKSTILQKSTKK